MQDTHEDRLTVYEIGYLVASSISEEKVGAEVETIKKILSGAKAEIVSEEAPHKEKLAYTIRRKTVAGSYEKYDEAHFGWVKFEVGSSTIDGVKKAVEIIPSIIRMLLITTVRENTFLGKHAPAVMTRDAVPEEKVLGVGPITAPASDVAPASIEEIDKSIDDMVKEA
jgi:ribosomal protein S6